MNIRNLRSGNNTVTTSADREALPCTSQLGRALKCVSQDTSKPGLGRGSARAPLIFGAHPEHFLSERTRASTPPQPNRATAMPGASQQDGPATLRAATPPPRPVTARLLGTALHRLHRQTQKCCMS